MDILSWLLDVTLAYEFCIPVISAAAIFTA